MGKKVLIVATVDQHIRHFHLPLINKLVRENIEVHIASNGNEHFENVKKKFSLPFERHPFKRNNVKSLFLLIKIMRDEHYDIIHVNTPVGATIGRCATLLLGKNKPKIIYTAHGFHFFKGAPKKYWFIFFPVEYLLAKVTNVLITINEEDYSLAKKFFGFEKVFKVNGVGIDTKKFKEPTQIEYLSSRSKLGVNRSDFMLLYVAEISDRKNQRLLIEIINENIKYIPNLKLFLLGEGSLTKETQDLILNLKLSDNIKMTGYVNNVRDYLYATDLYVSTSKQEGLPVNLIEAICTGKRCLVTGCRGNIDLMKKYPKGEFVNIDSDIKKNFSSKLRSISELANKSQNYEQTEQNFGKEYDQQVIIDKIWDIYIDKLLN